MGRMLDALRRIDGSSAPLPHQAEQRVEGPAGPPPVVSTPAPSPPKAPVAPCAASPAGSDCGAGVPPARAAQPATPQFAAAGQASPVGSRWWKTPPLPGPVQDPNTARAKAGLIQARKSPFAGARAVQERAPALAEAGSVQGSPLACSDVVSHLLQEFPPGRSAVLLLCDPESVDVAPAVAALAVALASQVTGQLLAIDGTHGDTGLARLLAAKPDAGEESCPGLADVLTGKAAWQQAVRSTRLPNIEMLPGQPLEKETDGEPFPPPADRWAAALRQFRQQYQFVLIGVSPGDNPAAPAMARWADATYLLIRPGHTGQRAARQAVRTLRRCGGRVLGCLLIDHSAGGC